MSDSPPETARFSRQTVETLAKRAANTCSNPDCRTVTSGPADESTSAVNVGEAAHIFGANPGSARHKPEMTLSERSDITNGIWLCRNCHGLIDKDVSRFPADVLFVWRQTHEAEIAELLGKTNVGVLRKALTRIPGFEQSSYLAQQIMLDKPYAWEYKLTVELLRSGLDSVMWRWNALRDGLYSTPGARLSPEELPSWYRERMSMLSRQVGAIERLLNHEFTVAWGPDGEPGSELAIMRTCALVSEACARILSWEEEVRSVTVPAEFEDCRQALSGTGGRLLESTFSAPQQMSAIFSEDRPVGTHIIKVKYDLPEGWSDTVSRSFERAMTALFDLER